MDIEGEPLLLASFKCGGWVFTCPNMVAVAVISQVNGTSSVSSIVLKDQGSATQIWSNRCLNSCCWGSALGPVPGHFANDMFPAACGV